MAKQKKELYKKETEGNPKASVTLPSKPVLASGGGLAGELAVLFAFGALGYPAVELAWRGTTHWTMALAGGIMFCLLGWLEHRGLPLWGAAVAGALAVTGLELLLGEFLRRNLHLAVWDYSREWGNIAGMICPKYSALWFALCLAVLAAMRALRQALVQ